MKYGFENPQCHPDVIEKRLNTMMAKYGALVSPLAREMTRERSADLNIKGRITLMERYGVDNAGKLEGNSDKKRKH